MPVHIDEMSSEVTVFEGELPMTAAQIDKLACVVMSRIAEKQRSEMKSREATELRRQSSAPFDAGT